MYGISDYVSQTRYNRSRVHTPLSNISETLLSDNIDDLILPIEPFRRDGGSRPERFEFGFNDVSVVVYFEFESHKYRVEIKSAIQKQSKTTR